jgi:hypothetical protein
VRHGQVRRESLLYVVVAATRPTYCGVLVVAAMWLTGALLCPSEVASAPSARKTPPAPPFAALFPLEQAWAITLPAAPSAPPAHDSLRIFVPLTSAAFVAISWEHGDDVWSVPLAATSGPVARDGLVYVASNETVHALDAETGAERWAAPAAGALQTLLLSGDRLVGVGAGVAHAFDAPSGRLLWTHMLAPAAAPAGMATSPDGVFVTFADGRVVSLAPGDGHEQWTRAVPGGASAPLVAGHALYVGATDNRFYSLDARTGKERWKWRTGGDVMGAAADADAKTVYYTSLDAVVRSVNAGNGHQRWKRDIGTRPVRAPVALDGSILVAGLMPGVSAFAPLTGTPLGTFELPGEVYGAPLVSAVLAPRAVGMAVLLKDGRAVGLRPLTLLFNESPREPLPALPGKNLPRERAPDPPATHGPSETR